MDIDDATLALAPTISVVVVCACFVLGVASYIVRRMTAPRRIPVPRQWAHLEQRRFHNPGALPRAAVALLISVVLVGGVIAGPLLLGEAKGISWYVREDWVGALFLAIALSGIAYYALRPKWPRCPACKSVGLHKDSSLPPPSPRVRVYCCPSCQIVWLTRYSYGRHRLHAPPHY